MEYWLRQAPQIGSKGSYFLSVLVGGKASGNDTWNKCYSLDPNYFPKAQMLNVFFLIYCKEVEYLSSGT